MNVAVDSNGSATWRIELWVHLDDNETIEAFESLEDEIDENPSAHTQEFSERIETTVDSASETTNREMTANEFRVATSRQSFAREYGVISYTFRWTGFAAVDGDRLHVGDAIEGINIDDGSRLLIEWPEEYELESISPTPDTQRNQAALWHGGETDFISGEPTLVLSADDGRAVAPVAAVSAGIAGVAVIGAGWWYRTRESESDHSPPVDRDTEPDGVIPDTSSDDSSSSPPPSLMSNEERLLSLLEENGGRMKQQTVVTELGWTDAKTSKVVTGLRDENELESFRIGRENVLSLPNADAETLDDRSE
ncbi:helix-turn-helix transcriptional regulator [Halostagnicola kamekurae]